MKANQTQPGPAVRERGIPRPAVSGTIHLALHLLTGGVLLAGGAATALLWDLPPQLKWMTWALPVVGFGVAVLGWCGRGGKVTEVTGGLCLVVLTCFLLAALAEGTCRLVGVDFAHEEEHWRRTPPYFRLPVEPTGEAFFRRSGPEEWSGQVLYTHLRQLGLSPNPYATEPAVTVRYDEFGFRNESGLKDWELVVVGDSFTELGYLTHEQLFTTLLGEKLHLRVRNLGLSETGPLAQLSCLQQYGVAPSTRRALVVFFEGNDLQDLVQEQALLEQARATGHRPYRTFRKRSSVLRAAYKLGEHVVKKPPSLVTAIFPSAQGPVQVGFLYAPPGRADLSVEVQRGLDDCLARYARFGREHGIEMWLAFMPCKERVLHGMVEFVPDAPAKFRQWQPTDLPAFMGELAAKHGVRFVDLTGVLTEETRRTRELLHNPIYDTHINARGSAVVAAELARHLASAPTSSQP
jgi:hypothetical protein